VQDYEDTSEERPQDDSNSRLPVDPHDARRRLNGPNPESVPLAFVPGPWSECSRTCGGAGLKSRQVTCEVRGSLDYRLIVSDSHCEKRHLSRPVETEDCGDNMCPTWQTGPWSEVSLRTQLYLYMDQSNRRK
jgi:Thrombospondin type 1 domain